MTTLDGTLPSQHMLRLIAVTLLLVSCASVPARQPLCSAAACPSRGPEGNALSCGAASTANTAPPTLVVVPLSSDINEDKEARALNAIVLAAIKNVPRYKVLERPELDAIVEAAKMSDAGAWLDASRATKIGNAVGAQYVVTGSLDKLFANRTLLFLRLFDTCSSTVKRRVDAEGYPNWASVSKMTTLGVKVLLEEETATEITYSDSPDATEEDYNNEYTKIFESLENLNGDTECSVMLAELNNHQKQTTAEQEDSPLQELFEEYKDKACAELRRKNCLKTAATDAEMAPSQRESPQTEPTNELEQLCPAIQDGVLSSPEARRSARALYAEGVRLLKAQNVNGSIEAFMRCVQADATYGACYRALGIAYARASNPQQAVRYYRQYLNVDPDARDADYVRRLVQEYEAAP